MRRLLARRKISTSAVSILVDLISFSGFLAHGGQSAVEVAQLQDVFRRHAGQKRNGQAVPNAHPAFLQILCVSVAVACAVKITIVEAAAFAGS